MASGKSASTRRARPSSTSTSSASRRAAPWRCNTSTPTSLTQLVLGQVLNGAIIGAMYGIIALGITLTFGITGIVNFALGEFMMIGAYATYALAERGLPYPVAVVPACLIAAAAGYLSNKAFFRFTRNNLVNGLLVSIGLISIFE